MKKICFCILILLIKPVWGNDVGITPVIFLCQKQEEDSFYTYLYHIGFYIKNISDKKLDIVSKIGGKKLIQRSNKDYEVVLGINSVKDINGTPVIPSDVSFELVTLKTGEAASIKHKFYSNKFLPKITLTYSITDFYNDRFGFWSGQVSSPNVTLNRECK
jgi:hypothetical protein